jgi:amino acid transporter
MFSFTKNSILILSCIISLIVLALIISFLSKSNIGFFQKMILIVAIIILFITLIIIAYSLQQTKNANINNNDHAK